MRGSVTIKKSGSVCPHLSRQELVIVALMWSECAVDSSSVLRSADSVMNGDNSGAGDPLHGVTLEAILHTLLERHGWQQLGQLIDIRCFQLDPSIKSSLKFLRRTPWARKKVEDLYLYRPLR